MSTEERLERAMIALLGATDSRGRLVRLHSGPYTAEAFKKSHSRLSQLRTGDSADPAILAALDRNRALLNRCYEAALAHEPRSI